MIVRSPVPRYYDYTDAENRERASRKTKQKKKRKGTKFTAEKKKKLWKIQSCDEKMTNVSRQGPVARTPVIANPGLNFNPGFFSFLSHTIG